MNPDDLHPWLRPHLPGFGADATAVTLPRPGSPNDELAARARRYVASQIGKVEPLDAGSSPITTAGTLKDAALGAGDFLTRTFNAPLNFLATVPEAIDSYKMNHPGRAAAQLGLAALPFGVGKIAREVAPAAEDAITMFDHYSPRGDLTELDPKFMGTGLTGAEKRVVDRPAMMHVYTAGAKPEPQFAGANMFKYSVPVKNARIYDIAKDPDGIVAKIAKNGLDPAKLEKAIGRAGYTGYNNSTFYPEIVKLFGNHPVVPHGVPPKYAILTAENPGGQALNATDNGLANLKLKKALKDMGFAPKSVKGAYVDEGNTLKENSFLVPGMTKEQAIALGKQFGQNSVITDEGFHDLKAGVTRAMGAPRYTTEMPYTQFSDGRRFTHDLHWDQTTPLETAAPQADVPIQSQIQQQLAAVDDYLKRLQANPKANPREITQLQQQRAKLEIDQFLHERRKVPRESVAPAPKPEIDPVLGPLDPDYAEHYDPAHISMLRDAQKGLADAMKREAAGKPKLPGQLGVEGWTNRIDQLRGMSPQEFFWYRKGGRFASYPLDVQIQKLDEQIAWQRKNLVNQNAPTPEIERLEKQRAQLAMDHVLSERFKQRMALWRSQDRLAGGSGLVR